MTERISLEDLALVLLDDCEFSIDDIRRNNQAVLDLKDALDQKAIDDLDGLLVDISAVIRELTERGHEGMAVLVWMVNFSEHLGAQPIDCLLQDGWHRNTHRIVQAAAAYFRHEPADAWRELNPEPMGVVIPFRPRSAKVKRIH